jgi:hypothetical protein
VSTFLTIPSETGQPPQCEEGLRTFTFEKLVPGGIAEVSPLHDPADEGAGSAGLRAWLKRGARAICLWILRETIVIMKASVIPRDCTRFQPSVILSC